MSFDQVLSDNYGGVYEATRHLLDLGHRKIGVIIPIFSVITILDRLEGYRVALKKYGIEMGEHLISQGPLRVEGGYQAAKVLFEDNPDVSAILSTHEAMTLGVMLYLKEKEIACPMDISVVSFDDPPWARAFTPTLTVVVQQAYRMGNEAAHLLWSKLFPGTERKQIRKIKLDTYLQVRESTGIRFEGVRSHERRN